MPVASDSVHIVSNFTLTNTKSQTLNPKPLAPKPQTPEDSLRTLLPTLRHNAQPEKETQIVSI